jgi:hypothetical protein
MPVISTAFDDDFFDESVIESDDRIESPCKRKCSKNTKKYFKEKNFLFLLKNAI